MRFAFKTAPQHTTWDAMLDVWRAADDIEVFESGWTFDHFYPIFSDSAGPCLEGWMTLAGSGPGHPPAPARHAGDGHSLPASGRAGEHGRDARHHVRRPAGLGIGAGWNEEESGAYGIELGTPRERSDRFEEACAVLTGLLSQPTTTFKGSYYQLTDARCEPKPVQQPHPPICIGGSGEKRTLRTAARFAQHWNFVGGSPEQFTRAVDVLHQHCADIGRNPAEILLSSHVPYTGDPAETAANAAVLGELGLELAIVTFRPPHTAAVLEPVATALAALS